MDKGKRGIRVCGSLFASMGHYNAYSLNSSMKDAAKFLPSGFNVSAKLSHKLLCCGLTPEFCWAGLSGACQEVALLLPGRLCCSTAQDWKCFCHKDCGYQVKSFRLAQGLGTLGFGSVVQTRDICHVVLLESYYEEMLKEFFS